MSINKKLQDDTAPFASVDDNEYLVPEHIRLIEELIKGSYIKKIITINRQLTNREKLCLYLAANGKSTKEISKILQIKESTVVTYRKKILKKLNSKNIAQAIFNGIRFEYLSERNLEHSYESEESENDCTNK